MSHWMRALTVVGVMALVPLVACTLYYQYQALGGAGGWRAPVLAAFPVGLIAAVALIDAGRKPRRRGQQWFWGGVLVVALLLLSSWGAASLFG